jgi:hypothetical protein
MEVPMATLRTIPPRLLVAALAVSVAAGCAAHREPGTASAQTAAAPPAGAPASAAPPLAADAFPSEYLLETIRTRWVFRGNIQWPAAERRYREAMAAASDDPARAAVVVALLASQDDVHSSLFWRGRNASHYHGLDDAERARLLPLLERDRAQTGRVASAMLADGVGYVLVPTIPAAGPDQVEAYARELQLQVDRLATQGARAWIVDLRLNGGGNLMPMLLGLRALLGTGVVGGTVDARRQHVHSWVLRSDGLYLRDAAGERRMAALESAGERSAPTAPVAVLVGPMTRSSGEGLALAFRGRPRCILVGEPTARGYTTGTDQFPLAAGGMLTLATGFMTDRAGAACTEQIEPELAVAGGDDFDDLARDAKVRAARARILRPDFGVRGD